jgi:hypothetical protein
VRILFIVLLSSIGLVASRAEPRVAHRSIAHVATEVALERGTAGRAALDAMPACVAAQVVGCAGRTLVRQGSGSDFTAGYGQAPDAWTRRRADDSLATPDAPAVGPSARRRQPEGRGPPRGPITA